MVNLSIEPVNSSDHGRLLELYGVFRERKEFSAFMYGGVSFERFLEFTSSSWIYLCILNGEIVGISILNGFRGKTAMFHFCMIGAYEHTADFGRIIFYNVFESGYFTTILGATPKCYKHVFPVLHNVGFQIVDIIEEYDTIKGKLRSFVFSKLTKDIYFTHNKEFIHGWR